MTHRVRTREWAGIDYYATLGVDSDATGAEIDDAFRRLAKELHPDRNPSPAAEDRFKSVATAYSALRDPVTRMAYDEFRMRIDTGTLYEVRREPKMTTRSAAPPVARAAPAVPRRPMPGWLRTTLAAVLIVAGLAAAGWAVVGAQAKTAGDTPIAVQVTLAIMAVKLIACGLIALWYPRLRARWMPHAGA
jgi:uncharacterized membrane protein YidH (DUF202 family)